ncbi:hypothetical protein Tco_1201790 [Tanacetum coccineum]
MRTKEGTEEVGSWVLARFDKTLQRCSYNRRMGGEKKKYKHGWVEAANLSSIRGFRSSDIELSRTGGLKNYVIAFLAVGRATASAQNDNGSLEAESIVRAASTRVRKSHFLEDKKIPSIGVFDDVSFYTLFRALGWLLEEINVTWDLLEKKRTRLQLYTKSLEENAYSVWRRRHI